MRKRFAFLLTALAVMTTAKAASSDNGRNDDDTPQRIVSFVKEEYPAEWYARQAEMWRAVTEREPKNEEAWMALYQATRYAIMFTDEHEDYSPLVDIWKAMRKAVPDSYADYRLTYCHAQFVGFHDGEPETHPEGMERTMRNMVKAIRMRPDEVDAYPDYVACLMKTGEKELMDDILKRWYASGTFSASLLNYAYNEMISLPDDALIFTNGDVDTYSKLILQGGKGLFAGVKVVCAPMLWSTHYREAVCRELGIADCGSPAGATQEEYDAWQERAVLYIISQTGRPAYFGAGAKRQPSFADKLYSEGLVSRYSERRYDNIAAKRRNYESRYLTDYLYETFVPETYEASAYRLNLNYIPCLKSLLDWYKEEGDKERYRELYGMMMTILRRTENVTWEKRQSYYDEINR
ncbi:MAG: hypothetical protein J6T64_06900 [Bacteroidaceae bacterium]|nr:hypothetical protein [Bacteroidaceae bacterium]